MDTTSLPVSTDYHTAKPSRIGWPPVHLYLSTVIQDCLLPIILYFDPSGFLRRLALITALPIPQPLLSLGIGWVGLTSVEGWDKEG